MKFSARDTDKLLCKSDISKLPGLDGIHSGVLREVHEEVGIPLQIIFKLMQDDTVSESWRQATVVPLFKRGKKSDPANYRPVSLKCKIMEMLVRIEINSSTRQHNLLPNDQHGFCSGRS
ncbi:uncharacterized protein [Diadema setosum]|uniref:uncharacterized protein n=1 Tax=Diadema setosum TaxID=31175 RepID=UPI003B3BC71E